MRLNQFDYLHVSEHAQASFLAEQYVGHCQENGLLDRRGSG